MKANTTRSAVAAKTLVLIVLGAAAGFYFLKTTNAVMIGGIIGLALSILWQ